MSTGKQTCFVVMGYHMKTDFQAQPPRSLDLDASYHHLIKPAVEEAGLECIRNDEIRHSGVIDVPMYEQLLGADVVVADLSTANPNALYELGVRHALRPHTTVVIAEDQLKYPFDVNHTVIRTYKHLGEDIGYAEVVRFKNELTSAIRDIIQAPRTDSPVYTYLPGLEPPSRSQELPRAPGPPGKAAPPAAGESIAELLSRVEECKKRKDFLQAAALLRKLRDQRKNEPYYVQQLALMTYKSESPDVISALLEARSILLELNPTDSTDPETLGLWGAVHKRLWERTSTIEFLNESVRAYERGFYMKNDYYNGINLAFMLDTRAAAVSGDEAVADWVTADRVRRRVIGICDQIVQAADSAGEAAEYWVLATLEEAHFALGNLKEMDEWRGRAEAAAGQPWMRESTREQLAKLGELRARRRTGLGTREEK